MRSPLRHRRAANHRRPRVTTVVQADEIERCLDGLVESLCAVGLATKDDPNLKPDEKDLLVRQSQILQGAVQELKRLLLSGCAPPKYDHDRSYRLERLWGLIGAAALLSRHGGEDEFKKRARWAHVRAAKEPRSRAIGQSVELYARPVLTQHPRWSSERIAREIEDKVNAKLRNLSQQIVKIDAIKKRISKIRTAM